MMVMMTQEEIITDLGNQGITDYKRITIRNEDDVVQKHSYIVTFNNPVIPKEVEIGYYLEKIEQ